MALHRHLVLLKWWQVCSHNSSLKLQNDLHSSHAGILREVIVGLGGLYCQENHLRILRGELSPRSLQFQSRRGWGRGGRWDGLMIPCQALQSSRLLEVECAWFLWLAPKRIVGRVVRIVGVQFVYTAYCSLWRSPARAKTEFCGEYSFLLAQSLSHYREKECNNFAFYSPSTS